MVGDDGQPTGLRVLSLRDLDGLEFPPVQWAVDEFIPTGSLSLMVGRPKAGKSLVAIDLLASVAMGETFLNRATAQGPCVYVPAEDALPLVRSRIWTRVSSERDVPLYVVPADGSLEQSLRIDEAPSFMELSAVVSQFKPAVMVLDPLRELHRRKENDADEMAELLRPLRQLSHETDTAIVLIHHRNKYGTDPSMASRGSSAIVGAVDQIISMDLSGDDGNDDLTPHRILTITVEGRYGPRQRIAAQLQPGLRWTPSKQRPVEDLAVPSRVWRHLEMTGHKLTAEQLSSVVDASKGATQNALTELVKVGHVKRLGSGSKGNAYLYISAAYANGAAEFVTATPMTNMTNAVESPEVGEESPQNASQIRHNGHREPVVIIECQGCGAPRGADGRPCHTCGSTEIVRTLR